VTVAPGQRIAVVGAGLAGLAAAWWLARRHEVTVFERHGRPGFTARSVDWPWRGRAHRIDVPLRVFYPGYYPTLLGLYRELGVDSEPVSYAATLVDADGSPYFRYRNLSVAGASIGVMAPQDLLLGARARRIALALLRFGRREPAALAAGMPGSATVGDWARARGYPADFVDGFLAPAIATVATCTLTQALEVPAAVVLDYLARGLVRDPVRRALHGADDVERRLLRDGGFALECGAPVAAVGRDGDGVRLHDGHGATRRFDHVVVAAPAPQALAMLADASADEAAALGGFRYAPVDVVTHDDPSLLPPRRRDWSPVVLRVAEGHPAPESTIWINAVQPALRHAPPVFQTVHPQREPAPWRVLGRARFERPLVDGRSARAWRALQALHAEPGRRLWFCGSYAEEGIPLLESAVRSAAAVARRLGAPAGAGDQPARRAANSA
jgi:predicted NAD/FAD-binding protein